MIDRKLHKYQKKKAVRPPSNVWEHFIKKEDGRAYCKYCNASYATTS